MIETGWSWAELQETPENVLAYRRLILEWMKKKADADG